MAKLILSEGYIEEIVVIFKREFSNLVSASIHGRGQAANNVGVNGYLA